MGKNKLEQAAIDCFGESGSMCSARMGFIEGGRFIIEQIEDFINAHVFNAHEMSDDNPDKQYYQGKDDILGLLQGLLNKIDNEK